MKQMTLTPKEFRQKLVKTQAHAFYTVATGALGLLLLATYQSIHAWLPDDLNLPVYLLTIPGFAMLFCAGLSLRNQWRLNAELEAAAFVSGPHEAPPAPAEFVTEAPYGRFHAHSVLAIGIFFLIMWLVRNDQRGFTDLLIGTTCTIDGITRFLERRGAVPPTRPTDPREAGL